MKCNKTGRADCFGVAMALVCALNSFRTHELETYKLVTRVTHRHDGSMRFSLQKENDKSDVRQRENPISKSQMRKVRLGLTDEHLVV